LFVKIQIFLPWHSPFIFSTFQNVFKLQHSHFHTYFVNWILYQNLFIFFLRLVIFSHSLHLKIITTITIITVKHIYLTKNNSLSTITYRALTTIFKTGLNQFCWLLWADHTTVFDPTYPTLIKSYKDWSTCFFFL
jgi:hypothetical protein